MVTIMAGSPTPDEERAVGAALEQVWHAERAASARASGLSPWVLAARAEATKRGRRVLRSARAWRLSGRVTARPETSTQTGRGDSK
jgi:hypothetical protein